MAESAEFTFDSKEWIKFLSELDKKWKDIETRKTFGGVVSSTVYKDIIEHFEEEKGPEGKWDEWSNAYATHLKKIGRSGNKILQFSGRLRQSFTPQSWRSTEDGILFFNKVPYAKHHDEGESSYKGNPRKFMWLSNKGMNSIVEQTLKWLLE